MHFAVEFVLCTFECVCECVPAAVDGLFGTFTMKPNTDYDPHDRKSIKFIRHRDVARSAVLVFNVQTFTANKKLHISLEPLTCLSHVCAECSIPCLLPFQPPTEAIQQAMQALAMQALAEALLRGRV